MKNVFCILMAYILGSIPSAYYVGKLNGIDLRKEGSGNLGFTNALRTLGVWWSIPVLIFDVWKGVAAVLIANWVVPEFDWLAIACGMVAILGHNWTLFLGFKGGGKGVATSAGVFLALVPIPFLIAFALFLVVLFTVRYMSLASMTLAIVLAISESIFLITNSKFAPSLETYIFSIIVAVLILIRHKTNIQRLIQGTENTFSFSKKVS